MISYYNSTTKFEGNGLKGTKNTVEIKDGKGYKLKEILNKKGATVKRIRKNLNSKEINTIMKGTFIPGFWDNCSNAKRCTVRNVNMNVRKAI